MKRFGLIAILAVVGLSIFVNFPSVRVSAQNLRATPTAFFVTPNPWYSSNFYPLPQKNNGIKAGNTINWSLPGDLTTADIGPGICIPSDPQHESPSPKRTGPNVYLVSNNVPGITANISEWVRMFKERGVDGTIRISIIKSTTGNNSGTKPGVNFANTADILIDVNKIPVVAGQPRIGDNKTGLDYYNAIAIHESGHACIYNKNISNIRQGLPMLNGYDEVLIERYSYQWYGHYHLIVSK